MHVLKLRGPLPGKLRVEMLPRSAERLPALGCFFLQSLSVVAADLVKQALIEVIAVTGDFWQQLRKRHGGIERSRSFAADAAGHQNRSRQHRGRLLQQLIRRNLRRVGQPPHQRIERDLLHHETAVAAFVVDLVRVPLPEVIVGPLIRGMIEVIGPWINRQLIQ